METEASLICTISVFVNGRGRAEIMEDMRSRIARGDIEKERADAMKVRPAIHSAIDPMLNIKQ